MHRVLLILVLTLACTLSEDDTPAARDAGAGPLVVYTVSDPLRSFAQRIGGNVVEVHFPAPLELADPAFWNPDTETVAAYQQADLVLQNGGGYAAWLSRASLRTARFVDTSASFADRMIPQEDAVTHAHGPEGDHSHTGFATTFWLDLDLARAQARAIADAFARTRPEEAAGFRERFDALDSELASLDARIDAAAASLGGRPVLFSHPVYQYFSRRYGLVGHSLHWEPDALPDGAEWHALKRLLETHPARIMIWEDAPRPETAAHLAGLGVQVVVFRPAGGRSGSAEFLTIMNENAQRLEAAR